MRVLVSTCLLAKGFEELMEHFEVVFPENDIFTKEEVIQLLPDFDAFIPTFQFKVDKQVIDAGTGRLKIIANYGVGYNNIDVDYATLKGIIVTNTPDPVIEPTAELAMALMLAVARRVAELDKNIRVPNGLKWGVMENLGLSLYGKTLGIIGMGRIGQALARRAIASGMNIVYHNRKSISPELEAIYKTRRLELTELLKISDVVSIHTPLTNETHQLINDDCLQQMKSSAILINTSRGGVVDEMALIQALKNKRIYAAGLDVYENEPNINQELFRLDNLVLSPHNGTATLDGRIEMSKFTCQNIIRFFAGNKNITQVN
jgi:lactate dehydrogenase-like 2-hydroxyacid dehydrogenase